MIMRNTIQGEQKMKSMEIVSEIVECTISDAFKIEKNEVSSLLCCTPCELQNKNVELQEQKIDILTIYDLSEMLTEIILNSIMLFGDGIKYNKPIFRAFFRVLVFNPIARRHEKNFTLSNKLKEDVFEYLCHEASFKLKGTNLDLSEFEI
jgi:hypothetical protein